MAVIENRSTEDGDILVIKPETPIVGLISLYQFVDTTTNESESDYFLKEFRYSVDAGLTFSAWTELTLINIQGVNITKYDQFVIEYKYTRIGGTPTVELTFEDILVSGNINSLDYPVYDGLVFKDFFEINNIYIFGWALNVLEKLYKKGLILPEYIERAENNNNLEDEDFIVYWNSATHFFAILVYFARQFENFGTDETLLYEFIKNKDLVFSDANDITDLIYLYQNYVDEYKKRGTMQILDKMSDGALIDGELIRLLATGQYDELVFALLQNYDNGWCIGKSSPTWKGTENIINLVKGYEFTIDVVDIAKYPIADPTHVTLTTGYLVLDEVPSNTICGVKFTSSASLAMLVSPAEDYEISFRVKQEAVTPNMTFGIDAFDINNNIVNLRNYTNSSINTFFVDESLPVNNTEYHVRGILWNANKTLTDKDIPNIGIGYNLKSVTSMAKILPYVTVFDAVSDITTKTYLRDLKVRPLKLNFSRGQLGVHNIIYLLCKINNGEFSVRDIKEIISNKLTPYNEFIKIKTL